MKTSKGILLCWYVGQSDYSFTADEESVEVGHWELGLFASEESCDEFLWEEASQQASSWGEQEEDQEECDFVDEHTTYGWVAYNPELENHLELAGYEGLRPERKAFLERRAKELIAVKKEQIANREDRLCAYVLEAEAELDARRLDLANAERDLDEMLK